MSAAALVEVLLMTFVLLAPAGMVAMLMTSTSRIATPRLAEVPVDTTEDRRHLRTAA